MEVNWPLEVLIGYGTPSGNLFQNASYRGHFYPKVILALKLRFEQISSIN